ncbi:hypothetical protein BHE74_00015434 [Ensete ventricosum]|nr:hypothetical protein GW17_00045221 [Ensete ventricosum]RWW76475.1 hypothetical protein BHE74_00015434 [Ensete ventricosum]
MTIQQTTTDHLEPPPQTMTDKEVVGFPSLIIQQPLAYLEAPTSNRVITTLPFVKVETYREERASRDNPHPLALPKESNQITPRIGRHLRRQNLPSLEASLDDQMQWEPQSHLRGINDKATIEKEVVAGFLLAGDADNKKGQQSEAVAARRCNDKGAFESGCGTEGSSNKRGGSGVVRSEGEEQRWPRWQRRPRPRRRLWQLQW